MSMDRRSLIAATALGASLIVSAAEAKETVKSLEKTAQVKRGYADGPYGQIHYRYVKPEKSKSLPLICLHASPLSGIVYDRWIEEMGKDRNAFAPDTPGYGGSDTPPEPVQIPDFANAMIRFMDELRIERTDIMGYHTGSFTAVDLARRFPKRIRKVVMISAPVFTDEEKAKMRDTEGRAVGYEQMLETTLNNARTRGRGMFQDTTDERYRDITLERMRHWRTSSWGFRATLTYDLIQGISEVKQPMLVLNPQDDLWEQTPRAKPYLNAQSRIHDLPGRTHGMMDGHTVEIATVVRGFLDT
ncbi:MAG: alpha/beta hydrolase [Rhodospirillaceae bacterium]|nr:alpha/beta hydrolase [Rhodospirillaceae bacterium]